MPKYKSTYEYIMIMIGVMLLSLAITLFYEPYGLVTGGVSGLGIIIQTVSAERFGVKIPLWLTNAVFNAPLFIIGAKTLGFKFLKRTLFATVFFSLALFITAYIPTLEGTDLLLNSVFGGVLSGIGVGIVFKYSSTTGGSDLAASIINKYYKHISLSKLMFGVDAVIISLGFFTFGAAKAMYAIISVFIGSKMIETILEGLSFAKAAFIISDKADEIASILMNDLERGVTGLNGQGMFTKKFRNVLLCVVSPKEVIVLKELVKGYDEFAFVIVADVREVLGEGFQSI